MHRGHILGSLFVLGLVVACGADGGEDLFTAPGGETAGVGGESGEGGESSEGGGGDEGVSGEAGQGGEPGEEAGSGGEAGGEVGGSEVGGAGGAPAVCGDGMLAPGEQCDDGNADDADGCAQCKVVCPAVAGVKINEVNGHCYWVLPGGLFGASWLEQHKKCVAQGGYMASVRSPQENDFVKTLHKGDVWIGATDGKPANEPGVGKYFWISKEPFEFSSWAQGEPNAFGFGCPPVVATCYEHCASQRSDGLWNDKNCNENSEAICEWTPPGVPLMASVLLVDDSSLVRRTIDKLLSDEGFQVTQAASAELAFEIAGRQPPAAIVSDLRMPGLSGVQLCRLLRAEPATASIPVVLLTASVDRRSRFWAQSAGAQAYVSKTDLRELPGVLRRVLATPVIAPPLPLLEPLSGGAVQRLAQLLDGALFFSVIAGELRSLARYETAEELFRAFAALASGVLSYRWLALAREEQGGVFVHGLPESDALRAEIRAVLPSSGSQRFQFFCEQQGGDGPRGEVLLREIRLGSRLLGRIALAPRHRGIPLEEGAFLDVAARELPLVFHTLGLVEEVRRLRAASSVVAPR